MNVAVTENRFSFAGIVLEASSHFYFGTEWMNNFVVAVTEAHWSGMESPASINTAKLSICSFPIWDIFCFSI